MTALRLDKLLIVPTSANPLKPQPAADLTHRRWFADFLANQVEGAEVDDRELLHQGPAFTIDTLQALQRQQPHCTWTLVVGSDTFLDFGRWQSPIDILADADIAVYRRGGAPTQAIRSVLDGFEAGGQICYDQSHNADEWHLSLLSESSPRKCAVVRVLPGSPPDISSTDIRSTVGACGAIEAFVPIEVAQYIHEHQLYRA